jgi:hypothetical protein
MFETHYDIDRSFKTFDPQLLSIQREEGGLQVFYANTLVHTDELGKMIDDKSVIQEQALTKREAISLWQMCYLSTHTSYDPERCAYVYREVNRMCHTCYGDGEVLTNEEYASCTVCDGTGKAPRKPRVEEWLN